MNQESRVHMFQIEMSEVWQWFLSRWNEIFGSPRLNIVDGISICLNIDLAGYDLSHGK